MVITGLSGSGKSSLALDTIYAEGQRRYMESLSSYARQFLDQVQKPKVESIQGMTPTIAIEQRTSKATPRSIVATTTEIYDYLRILFARIGEAFCPECQHPIQSQSPSQVTQFLLRDALDTQLTILSPVVRGRKGEHKDIIANIKRAGFVRLRIDSSIYKIDDVPFLDKNFQHSIEVFIDRVTVNEENKSRITESLETAFHMGKGLIITHLLYKDRTVEKMFSEHFACPYHGIVLAEISPRLFSFNSPFGACSSCNGLGNLLKPSEKLVINENLSLEEGAIVAWKKCGSGLGKFYNPSIRWLCRMFDLSSSTLWKDIPEKIQKDILYGKDARNGTERSKNILDNGILGDLENRFYSTESSTQKELIHQFMNVHLCPDCKGHRLKPEVLSLKIKGKNIWDTVSMTVEEAVHFFSHLKLQDMQAKIATPIIKTVLERLSFLNDVGLSYLNLNRATNTLSGGEAQRIKLSSQLGSQLSGVTYVLDEPTIGLHQRDNKRLIDALHKLKKLGNTVLVVEHDEEVIKSADWIVDIGPRAGTQGGKVVYQGTVQKIASANSLTALYLKRELQICIPQRKRPYKKGHSITLKGCNENNLKNFKVNFPLSCFVCVTGVSGSGKSTLVNTCLYKSLQAMQSNYKISMPQVKSVEGDNLIDKIINIDQSPIGKTSRSNPVTYTGCFSVIRAFFSAIPLAKERGYSPGRFSFNVKGGRCEACQGIGNKNIEMHFLPDIAVQCDVCKGQRYNEETLQVCYKGKNIFQVLEMTVSEAIPFFTNHPSIKNTLTTLKNIGLDYIKLGQSSTTLSGGEAQRIKLASELTKRNTGRTLYIMDEPTTGLHFHDIDNLLNIIHSLVDLGNTVIVIEHNMDVIKCADWVVDLGPEGGKEGGKIIATGIPEKMCTSSQSYTAQYLKQFFYKNRN